MRSYTVSCDVDSNQEIVVMSHCSLLFDGTYTHHVSFCHCGLALQNMHSALCSIKTRGEINCEVVGNSVLSGLEDSL